MSKLVQEVCHVPVTSSRVSVQAEAATEHLARLLRRSTGSPVLVCTFTFLDHEQRPLEAVRATYPADRYTLRVDLSRRLIASPWPPAIDEARPDETAVAGAYFAARLSGSAESNNKG